MYKNTRDFVEKWAEERKAGLKGYRINQLKQSFLPAVKVFIFLVIVLTGFQTLILGFYLQDSIILLLVSASSFILIPINAIYTSSGTWNDNEKMYEQCVINIEKHSKDEEPVKKVKVEYPRYKRLKIIINLFYLSAMLGISLAIFGLLNPWNILLLLVLVPWVYFFGSYRYLQSHFKNPVCNHLIFDDSQEKRHPDVEGTLGDNIRDILLADQFKCFQCGIDYFASKENNKYYLEN